MRFTVGVRWARRRSWHAMSLRGMIVVAVCIAALASGAAVAQDGDIPRFEPDACPYDAPFGQTINCGWLVVPEDYRQPEGRTIRLAVAIVKSTGRNPKPDPLIHLAGGPGGAVVAFAPMASVAFAPFLSERDVILIDQRGAGLSQPSLSCPEATLAFVSAASADDRLTLGQEALTRCRERLTAEGIDLSLYNSAQNAADIAALREALGYAAVNLYGTSYGTRLALTVMRDHPEGIRSVILDSTYPPQANIYLESAANYARAFDTLVEGCASDLLCRLAYSDVRGVYEELYERLNAAPVTLHVGVMGQAQDITVDGAMLADLVFLSLYNRAGIERLPAALYGARDGNYDALKPLAQEMLAVTSSLSYGMFLSTQCYDEAPFTSHNAVAEAAAGQPGALHNSFFGEFGFQACAVWGRGAPDAVENEPVTSDIPTLALAGAYDPVTPPAWGKLTASTLSNSTFVEFPGIGHGVALGDPCPTQIALSFLSNPAVKSDASCAAGIRGPQFVVTAPATRPYAQAATLLLLGVALWGAGGAGVGFWRRPRWVAWRASVRSMGWIPLVASAGVVGMFMLLQSSSEGFPWADKTRVIESFVPLAIGVQAALLFSPDDEPALEVLLACPRRITWVMVERLAVMFIAQTGIALVGAALSVAVEPDQDVLVALVRWIPPALFLSGVGVYVTLRSRVAAFGIAVVGIVWFAFSFFGALFIPGQPVFWPLNYVQPFLWPANAFLQPGQLAAGDYWLNRLFVSAAGVGLVMLAAYQLRSEERVLLGGRKAKGSKGAM